MSGNRFEFLELGEDGTPPQRLPQPEEGEAALPGRDPVAEKGPGGEPLAQVRDVDLRGYRTFLVESEEQAEAEALRDRLRGTPGRLRAVEVFGERGHGAGQFHYPTGLAADNAGVLFVADSYNHRIQRITPDGGVSVLGGRGSGRGQFLSPQGVATDSRDSFYVVEQGNHRVQKYAVDGTLLLIFGRLGAREGEFRGPTDIAVAPGSGDIYVADAGNGRIQRFDAAGYFVAAIHGPKLPGASPFSPQAVAVDRSDTLYVGDPFAGRVWRYDSLGRSMGHLTTPLHQPRALACGEDSLLYVADAGEAGLSGWEGEATGRVLALHGAQSRTLATLEQAGQRHGALARPGGLTAAPGTGPTRWGDLYVADTRNHRIVRYLWE